MMRRCDAVNILKSGTAVHARNDGSTRRVTDSNPRAFAASNGQCNVRVALFSGELCVPMGWAEPSAPEKVERVTGISRAVSVVPRA